MGGYVYVLKLCNGSYYVGSTRNINERLVYHNKGRVKSTSKYLPAQMIYWKEYDTIQEAIEKEKMIKRMKNRGFIELFIAGKR